MAFKFLPTEMLRKIAPKSTVKKLVSSKLTVNRAAVTMLEKSGVLSKKKLETIALKVIKGYKDNYTEAKDAGATSAQALQEATTKSF
jgi:Trm5-related predicted tRNA methylase